MKYETFKKDLESKLPKSLCSHLLENIDIWTNNACCGYIIMAMEEAGSSPDEIEQMLGRLHYIFDLASVENAEDYFRKWRSDKV